MKTQNIIMFFVLLGFIHCSQEQPISYGFVLEDSGSGSQTIQIITTTNYTCKIITIGAYRAYYDVTNVCAVYSSNGYWYAYIPATSIVAGNTVCVVNCDYYGEEAFDPSFFSLAIN